MFKLGGPTHTAKLAVPAGWHARSHHAQHGPGPYLEPNAHILAPPDDSAFIMVIAYRGHDDTSLDGIANGWAAQTGNIAAARWRGPRQGHLGAGRHPVDLWEGTATRGGEPAAVWQLRRKFQPRERVTHLVIAALDRQARPARRQELLGCIRSYQVEPAEVSGSSPR